MRGRFESGLRAASLTALTALLLAGCTPWTMDGRETGDAPAPAGLYTGPIPAPATLPAAPALPPVPVPPSDYSNEAALEAYSVAMQQYAEAVMSSQELMRTHGEALSAVADSVQAGGEQSVAAWQSLLVTAGIAVSGPDGSPIDVNGETGFGWALTDAQLRLHSALSATPGGLRLIDLAEALSEIPETSGLDWAALIRDDLLTAADLGYTSVYWMVGPDFFDDAGGELALDDIVLSWGQVGLLLYRLSAELATYDAAESGVGDDPAASGGLAVDATTAGYDPSSFRQAGARRPCELSMDPWTTELLNQFNKAHSTFVFDMVIDALEAKKTARGVGIARLLAAFATLAAKVASLTADFSVSNAPLVRTKSTSPGEVRDLTVTLRFDDKSWSEIRECINLFMAPLGLEIPGQSPGVGEKIDIDLRSGDPARMRIGDGAGGSRSVTQGRTDSNGAAHFNISGAPQLEKVPERAEPDDLDVEIRAVTNLGGNDFFKDMASLPWDAVDAASSGGLSVIPAMLGRMRMFTFHGTVPVRDWKLDAEFEAAVSGSFTTYSASNVQSGGGCGEGTTVRTSSTSAVSTFHSEKVSVTAELLSNPDRSLGGQAVVFTPQGTAFTATDLGNGVRMFPVPVAYETDKSHSEPASGPVPPLHVEPPSVGCGDGGGEGSDPPPPDCGVRDYAGSAEVAIRSPRTLYVGGEGVDLDSDSLWSNCGGSLYPHDPPMAPKLESCDSATPRGGKMPSIDDIFDPSKATFEIYGSLQCRRDGQGHMSTLDYEWTIVLCRIIDDEPAC